MRYKLAFLTILILAEITLPFSAWAYSVSVNALVDQNCGNGILDPSDACEGADLNGKSCSSFGYYGGVLSCNANCTFNVSACTLPPAGDNGGTGASGGGGGAGVNTPSSGVIFSGRAYPRSTVTLLKDSQVAASTVAGSDSIFQMSLAGISPGNYIFSLYSEDSKGLRSSLSTFPISITSGVTASVSGVFIPPTMSSDKEEVKRGDTLTFFGQSVPSSEILIQINSDQELFAKVKADQFGGYSYALDTSELDYGSHVAKSKASLETEISPYGRAAAFLVSDRSVVRKVVQGKPKGDINTDGKVNLVDFSILAYWYKRPSPPTNIDLNADGKVDLADFSIMVYYWTG